MADKHIFNVHTHTFNAQYVPDCFLGNIKQDWEPQKLKFVSAMLRKPWLANKIIALVAMFMSDIRKYKAFLTIGTHKSQDIIFDELSTESGYPGRTRFVVLPLNFKHMAEKVEPNYLPYEQQLLHLRNVQEKNIETCIPFLHIDPRAFKNKNEALSFLQNWIGEKGKLKGFAGIKLYPSLGYFPYHPIMEHVFAFASAYNIPILTHCSTGGAFYYGKGLENLLTNTQSFNTLELCYFVAENEKIKRTYTYPSPTAAFYNDHHTDYFLQPEVYIDVLKKFPNLKICFAHFGGDYYFHHFLKDTQKIKLTKKEREYFNKIKPGLADAKACVANNWHLQLRKLLTDANFPNVYVDISYSLYDDHFNTSIIEWLSTPEGEKAKNRILYGTDFFMTLQEEDGKMTEEKLYQKARKAYSGALFEKISHDNPREFLSSDFYKF